MGDLEDHEHLVARGFLTEVDHPVAGRLAHLGAPFRSSTGSWGPLEPAPLLDPEVVPAFGPRRSIGPTPIGAQPGRRFGPG